MKKLVLTIAIVLCVASMSFGQSIWGKSSDEEPLRVGEPGIVFPGHNEEGDFDADGPLGSGIAVLIGLGGAYMLAKKRDDK